MAQAEAVLEAAPQAQTQDEVEELTVEELIEDVSIDGMCGVY